MILAWLLLLTGLTISAVAIYYSVVGLAAIFSAAVIPIVIMGTTLEIAKLVCASWLKANWERAPRLLKSYMSVAVVVLMIITSMGIFGFLSKAHNDQNLVSGDVQSRIAIYDEKIRTAKDNIEANRKALKQMDEAVDQSMARSTTEQGADKAVAIRRSQAKERTRLQNEIASEQKTIATLNEEAAPIRAEVRKVEAEVGPIKYIAKFIYGDNGTDENMLEKAVTWVIILIVIVFDPLAVIMLLAAQMTFGWHNKNKDPLSEDEEPLLHDTVPLYVADVSEPPKAEELQEEVESKGDPHPIGWAFPRHANIHNYQVEDADEEIPVLEGEETWAQRVIDEAPATKPLEGEEPNLAEQVGLEQWNAMIAEAEKAIEAEKTTDAVERPGDYLTDTEDPSKKKDIHDEGYNRASTDQEPIVEGYVQNAEQDGSTLWTRIQERANAKPKDELYRLYSENLFNDLIIDKFSDPALYAFVEETKIKGPKFANYSPERLNEFVSRIYELRKNNSNNTA